MGVRVSSKHACCEGARRLRWLTAFCYRKRWSCAADVHHRETTNEWVLNHRRRLHRMLSLLGELHCH